MKLLTSEEMFLRKPANILFIKTEEKSKLICDNCGSDKIIDFSAHCVDEFGCHYKDKKYYGYVPGYIGIGGGDDIEIKYCADCGKIQGRFPIDEETIIDELSAGNCDEFDED